MGSFKIITFDVEHGSSHFLKTPNDAKILIDAGSRAEFSPAIHLKENWQIEHLNWLTITHFDADHLTDIEFVAKHISPFTLEQPSMTDSEIISAYGGEISQYLQSFLNFRKNYAIPVPSMGDPSRDWGGVQFATFSNDPNDFDTLNINNLSIATFAKYQGWTILFPGDLEAEGWKKLLEKDAFKEWLKEVDVLVAAHHGRKAGYCEEIFEYCSPILVIVSDKGFVDTSVTPSYVNQVIGEGLLVRSNGNEKTRRKVLTTRSDGVIHLDIDPEGRYSITTNTTS